MKYLLLLGAVNARAIMNLDGDDDTATVTPKKFSAFACQQTFGTYVFDVNKFDAIGSKEKPNIIDIGTDRENNPHQFYYKVCQDVYTVKDTDIKNEAQSCNPDKKFMAFSAEKDGNNYECYSQFGYPTIEPIAETNEDAVESYKGFTLKYTAKYEEDDTVKCGAGLPMTVTIHATCNKDIEGDGNFDYDESASPDLCTKVVNYEGANACNFFDLNLTRYFPVVLSILGALSIITGLVLALFGSKFILIVIGFLLFLCTQALAWGILYNTHMVDPAEAKDNKPLIIGVGVGIAAVGGVAAYYLTRFADRFAVPIISGWCGAIVTFMIVGPIQMPGLAKTGVVILVAGTAAWYSYKIQRFVKSVGTALIGSFLLFNGLGKYIGHYPSLMDTNAEDLNSDAAQEALEKMKDDVGLWALFYIGGTVVFTIFGTWFQMTYVSKKDKDDYDMMDKDDS